MPAVPTFLLFNTISAFAEEPKFFSPRQKQTNPTFVLPYNSSTLKPHLLTIAVIQLVSQVVNSTAFLTPKSATCFKKRCYEKLPGNKLSYSQHYFDVPSFVIKDSSLKFPRIRPSISLARLPPHLSRSRRRLGPVISIWIVSLSIGRESATRSTHSITIIPAWLNSSSNPRLQSSVGPFKR